MEENNNKWEQMDSNESYVQRQLQAKKPTWLANVGLILCIFSFTPGLIFAIIGLNKLHDKASRVKCIAAIIIFAIWMVVSFIIGFVYAEEILQLYM